MISEQSLRMELKRYPSFIKKAIKEKKYLEVLQLHEQMSTIEWILSNED